MVSYAKDQAVVAKHPPRERATSTNGGKAFANEPSDHGGKATAKKWASTLGIKSIYQRGGQRANDGKASARDPQTAKHPSRKKTPPAAKHPQRGAAMTLSAAKQLPKWRPATTTAKHPSKKKVLAAKHPLATMPAR
jgi:hypothetical protein